MNRLTENKLILITRRTRLDELIARFNTLEQARFYIERIGVDFSDYLSEDERYKAVLKTACRTLEGIGLLQVVDRSFVPNFIFGEHDTVIVLGQDGLVANTLKYLQSQPVLGVNPDPARWEGVLLPFKVSQLEKVLLEVFDHKRSIKTITMSQAVLNTGQTLYGVNDLFIGPRSHTSARYKLTINGQSEFQSSSGVIVSTGLGSTGWFRSIITGAATISTLYGSTGIPAIPPSNFAWDAEYLYYSVREPWPSRNSSAALGFGRITPGAPLVLESNMPEDGVIFSDGIERDFLAFNSGIVASVQLADKTGHLVV